MLKDLPERSSCILHVSLHAVRATQTHKYSVSVSECMRLSVMLWSVGDDDGREAEMMVVEEVIVVHAQNQPTASVHVVAVA